MVYSGLERLYMSLMERWMPKAFELNMVDRLHEMLMVSGCFGLVRLLSWIWSLGTWALGFKDLLDVDF